MMMHDKNPFSTQAYIERVLDKRHSLERDAVRKKIEEFNFKIQFQEPTWVLKEEGGGFSGNYFVRATQIDDTPFGVLSVEKDKKTQCSRIHVWSDGCADGHNCFLINVPNGLFKEIHNQGT